MPSDYVAPKLNSSKRFSEMEQKANAAAKSAPKAKPADDSETRINNAVKSMDKLSVDALIRRAKAIK